MVIFVLNIFKVFFYKENNKKKRLEMKYPKNLHYFSSNSISNIIVGYSKSKFVSTCG